MDFFTQIPGAVALIHSGGVYQQTELYARGERIYAKKGSGYVKLGIGGATSAPKVRWTEYEQGDTAIITEKMGNPPILESMGDVQEAAE